MPPTIFVFTSSTLYTSFNVYSAEGEMMHVGSLQSINKEIIKCPTGLCPRISTGRLGCFLLRLNYVSFYKENLIVK